MSMKKIINLFISASLLILFGCSIWQKNWYDTFYIINETNYDIRVLSYATETLANETTNILVHDTIIASKDTYIATQYSGELDYLDDPANIIGNTDSIRFIWGDNNVTTYFACDKFSGECMEIKNPLFPFDFYSSECVRRVGCDYTYIIKEEDLLTN